jgi:hypothetical protein
MPILWVAFGLYIVGVGLILYIRPQSMFHIESGTWKEFGMGRSAHYTLFPFWMFTVVWAFMSYALATLITVAFGNLALQTLVLESGDEEAVIPKNLATPISKVKVPKLPATAVAAPATPVSTATPGYYILETPKAGSSKYVYFGTSPPSLDDLERYAGK